MTSRPQRDHLIIERGKRGETTQKTYHDDFLPGKAYQMSSNVGQ